MRLMVYEGTPDEIRQVVDTLPKLPLNMSFPLKDGSSVEPDNPDVGEAAAGDFVSVKFARKMLTRRGLSVEQLKVLRRIYKAFPGKVTAPELQKLVGYTTSQFAGLMGAFGRRLTHTKGYVDPTWFFDQEWDYANGYNLYGLPESVCEAMRIEKLI